MGIREAAANRHGNEVSGSVRAGKRKRGSSRRTRILANMLHEDNVGGYRSCVRQREISRIRHARDGAGDEVGAAGNAVRGEDGGGCDT